MRELYWGNKITLLTTFSVLLLVGYLFWLWQTRSTLTHWGLKTFGLFGFGLFVCCMVAARDNYHLSVQGMIEKSEQLGLFRTDSIQSILACIGGGLLFLLLLSLLFIKNQEIKRVICFLMGSIVSFKLIFIEISRIMSL